MTSHDVARARACLEEDRAALVVEQPFVALLALHLDLEVTETLDADRFGGDGERVLFDLRFVLEATPAERCFALAHAIWHCALLHPWRRRGREPACWDRAIDHEVNTLLASDRPLPPGAFRLDESVPPGAEAACDWLCAKARSTGGPPTLPPRGPLADRHGEPSLDLASLAEPEPARQWTERLLSAVAHADRRGLAVPEHLRAFASSRARPTRTWREALRHFVLRSSGDRRVWIPPSRRHLARGQYLPSRRDDLLRLVVAVDVSGSTIPLATELLAELSALARAFPRHDLTVIEADHAVRRVVQYPPGTDGAARHVIPWPAGGTDLGAAFAEVARLHLEPSVLVFLTDGRGPAPASPPRYPVIWALPPDGRVPAPWGMRLQLEPITTTDRGRPRAE
jgi:predicted metal-dependent peptidase